MNRTAHPVMSPLGCLGGALLLFGIVIAVWLTGGAIFSPGELSVYAEGQPLKGFDNHAAFENDCAQCHEPAQGVTAERCEACHTTTAVERRTRDGLHGKLEPAQASACATCHPDHRGRDFDANAHALRTFDHAGLGFSLARHIVDYDNATIACEDCHTGLTFAFEPATCVQCHREGAEPFMADHVKAFGSTCSDCHDGVDQTSGFDHAATAFALEGRHQQVACADCHTPDMPPADAPQACAACHAEPDIHRDSFGEGDCAVCHTAQGWAPARLGDRTAFDHARTDFQLVNHRVDFAGTPLACAACHPGSKSGEFSASPTACADCHAGQDAAFVATHITQYGPNCASCHDGAGNMKGFDHNRVFVLDGAHTGATCGDCHSAQTFRGTPAACADCHAEPPIHAGIFGIRCEACHTSSAWVPAQLIRHDFPLDHGGEGEIACETCHQQSYVESTCVECHQAEEMVREHTEQNLTTAELAECAVCHPLGLTEDGSKP